MAAAYNGNQGPSLPVYEGNTSIAENLAVGTVIGKVSATDPEGKPLTYSASEGFTVVGDQVVTTKVFDFEQGSTVAVTLQATDIWGASSTTAFELQIIDGVDVFQGSDSADNLIGTMGADAILGLGGNDRLEGAGGRDTLTGGRGADKLIGGEGRDVFVFTNYLESRAILTERDTIYDFPTGDRIDLREVDANTKAAGNQGFSYIGTKAFTGTAGELRYDKAASDTYIYGDLNGDRKADFSIKLDDAVTLTKGFFYL